MNTEQRFYYLRIIKIIDTYNIIYPESKMDKETIISSLDSKDTDYYMRTYFNVMKTYKAKINTLNEQLHLY